MKKVVFFCCIIGFVFAACRKPDQFNPIPTLEYKSIIFSRDTSGFATFTLTTTFTDGDGDVGYTPADYADPNSLYNSNFVMTLLRWHNGAWTDTIKWCKGSADTLGIFSMPTRLPYMTPAGKNKGLKGDIMKTEDLPACLKDTIKITAYLYDRALHKSNVVETPAYFIDNP
jgi:hypothetical protein